MKNPIFILIGFLISASGIIINPQMLNEEELKEFGN